MDHQLQDIDDAEKGTHAWDVYVSLAERTDRDLTESWEKGIDVLLVYAALFSSVLASFLSQSFSLTQPSQTDLINAVLLELSQSLHNVSVPPPLLSPRSGSTTIWINGLWFSSLICALSASFFAMLARQWIQEYKRWMSAYPDDVHARARLRHFRHASLQRWHVSTIIWTLPFVLHVSLLLFFTGLVLFSFLAHPVLAILSGLLVALTVAFYIITLILPLFFAQCPFQTPPIRSLQHLSIRTYHSLLQAIHHHHLLPSTTSKLLQHQLTPQPLPAYRDGSAKEAWAIAKAKHTIDAQVLASLISTSWDTADSDKLIATAITSLVLPSSSATSTSSSAAAAAVAARDILRASDAARLIEKRYLSLLRLANEFPHLSIAPGRQEDAYTYLRALLHLCEHKAVPPDWQPSNRLCHSLHSCKQTADCNMRSIVLALIDSLNALKLPSAYTQV